MKHRLEFNDEELKSALKKHFKIKGKITFYHVRSFIGNGHSIEWSDLK